jgi:hypothetical protein
MRTSLGQHATDFDGEIKAMNTTILQLFGRTWSCKWAVIYSDSITAI